MAHLDIDGVEGPAKGQPVEFLDRERADILGHGRKRQAQQQRKAKRGAGQRAAGHRTGGRHG